MARRLSLVPAGCCLAAALVAAGSLDAQTIPPLTGDDVVSVRVRFGITDSEPRSWNGSVEATGGDLLALRNWSVHPSESVDSASWTMATRPGMNYPRRVYQWEDPKGTVTYLHHPGVVVDVAARTGTRLAFSTPHGDFDLRPSDLRVGEELSFLDGAVLADRVAPAEPLSSPEVENDFATMTSGEDGEVWAAWTAYRDGGVSIVARRFDGSAWQPAIQVTDEPGDRLMPKLGLDGRGRPWVVWSEQVDGNFDLYGRYLQNAADGSWSATERLTYAPQADIEHELASDAEGNLWLVWQGFRNGRSDIFVRRWDGNAWSPATQVSQSAADDWHPAVATDSKGSVYVAWETYENNDFDIRMRSYVGGSWSDIEPVADTLRYEAYPSLACDSEDRLWVAWNESGLQWGKDTGFLLNRPATQLYQSRTIAVAVYDGGAWQQPARGFEASMPPDLRAFNDFPRLRSDKDGRIWAVFRHRHLRQREVPHTAAAHRAAWETYATAFDGRDWLNPIPVPATAGRSDAGYGFSVAADGSLYAAWATDNRVYDEYFYEQGEVLAAKLPVLDAPVYAARLVESQRDELRRFMKHPNEQQDVARIRGYEIKSQGKTYRIYRGDTHRHTEYSGDGNNDGAQNDTYRYAMNVAELDYLGMSEHHTSGGPNIEYINWLLQQRVDVFHVPGRFVPLFGYERSLSYPNGHRNVFFAKRGNPTFPTQPDEAETSSAAVGLFDYLKRYDGISIPHTPATGMGTDWRDNDPAVEPLVEIYQGDRVSAEYEGAPKAATEEDLTNQAGGFRPKGYVWNAWAKGYKIGVQASSDHLSTHISYACTIAEEFTREGLLDAMRKRHNYAATDNIVLDYRMRAGGREYLQGDVVPGQSTSFELVVKILGTAPVKQVDVIRGKDFVYTLQNQTDDVSFSFVDQEPVSGEVHYYVRVQQGDGQIAWSSPIWVSSP
jgi:hypothetical protein